MNINYPLRVVWVYVFCWWDGHIYFWMFLVFLLCLLISSVSRWWRLNCTQMQGNYIDFLCTIVLGIFWWDLCILFFSLASVNAAKHYISHWAAIFWSCAISVISSMAKFLFFLVEWTFLGMRCMWPFMVADYGGRYFITAYFVNPGSPISWLLAIALRSVVFVGEKKIDVYI